jgi:hypothetical protein
MSSVNPSPNPRGPPDSIAEEKEVYIYAEVDIDKAFHDILAKSKKIRNYLAEKGLSLDFTEKMRSYKNFVRPPPPSASASTTRSRSSSTTRNSPATCASSRRTSSTASRTSSYNASNSTSRRKACTQSTNARSTKSRRSSPAGSRN